MGTYNYKPLIPNARTIRLLTLLPGAFDDEIRITLNVNLLADWYKPSYEALSYTWGSPDNSVNIVVGHSGDATLSVTQDLATALRYLRPKDRERVLWIDAICVNQRNAEERGLQVRRMAEIYSNAHRVVIWLGPESKDSREALVVIQGMALQLDIDWESTTMKPSAQGDTRWADPTQNPYYNADIWTPLQRLLRRSWFNRLWIWQEVRLARSADILCGYDTIPWKSLRDAMFCLDSKHKPADRSPREIDMGDCVARVYQVCGNRPGYVTLLDLLELTAHCLYTDQRDKVYALQNLVGADESIVGMEPSYSDSPRDVFQNVVLRYLTRRRCLKLLSCCGRRGEFSSKPTWVPNWSRDEDCFSLPQSSYSVSLAEAEYLGNGLLKATGLCSTYVLWAEAILPDLELLSVDLNFEVIQAIRRLWERLSPDCPYTGGGDIDEAFCRTLCAGSFAEDHEPPNLHKPTLKRSKEFLAGILGPQSGSTQYYTLYLAQIIGCITGRSFIMTREGHLGVGPKAAKVGDKVCKILGCHSLLLLRSAGPQHHTVRGECYIHGLMDDIAILGPFPAHWKYIRAISNPEEHCYYDNFASRPSGEFARVDPRLGPLPPGWRTADHDKVNFFNWYVNDATGEGYEYNFDPRMTAEALRERGVPLQRFLLE